MPWQRVEAKIGYTPHAPYLRARIPSTVNYSPANKDQGKGDTRMTESRSDQSIRNRSLGNTGLLVSPLCFGCAPLGDMPETFGFSVAKERAHETLRTVMERLKGASVKCCESLGEYRRGTSSPRRPTATSRRATSAESRCAAR